MKALVLTPKVLSRLSQYSISSDWFDHYGTPEKDESIKRVVISDIVYLLERGLDHDEDPIIVINLSRENVFADKATRSATLERIITTGHSIFTDSVSIPTNWRKHVEGSLFSIQASSRDSSWRARVHFEMRPRGFKDLFVFSRLDDTKDFAELSRHLDVYDSARAAFPDAVLAPFESSSSDTRAGITLSERLPQGFVQGATLEQWYASKLTSEQREFVDKPHDGPVRLRGSAGTGKTLSLVIKFLRDAGAAAAKGRSVKFGFLTHSYAS
ncbi:MAG: hypothetical protein KDD44_15250, partial [Bdellovibrionales bacterium]|nr:hypothetical protein [Bdellovibrionales bacterium]